MQRTSLQKENRKHARTPVRLPLHFQTDEDGGAYPGLTIDASESGLLIQTLKEMPVGIRIDIEILFPKKLYLPSFKAKAEIVRKDIYGRGDSEGYQYGLKFIRISKEDYLKLKRILSSAFCLKEMDVVERSDHSLKLVVKQNESIKTGSYRVLIVDDEEMIRNILCSLLPR